MVDIPDCADDIDDVDADRRPSNTSVETRQPSINDNQIRQTSNGSHALLSNNSSHLLSNHSSQARQPSGNSSSRTAEPSNSILYGL
eukprot:gene12948-3791_t